MRLIWTSRRPTYTLTQQHLEVQCSDISTPGIPSNVDEIVLNVDEIASNVDEEAIKMRKDQRSTSLHFFLL